MPARPLFAVSYCGLSWAKVSLMKIAGCTIKPCRTASRGKIPVVLTYATQKRVFVEEPFQSVLIFYKLREILL